eukprot:11128071-Lingulodinium_polyedra.AAC.1
MARRAASRPGRHAAAPRRRERLHGPPIGAGGGHRAAGGRPPAGPHSEARCAGELSGGRASSSTPDCGPTRGVGRGAPPGR